MKNILILLFTCNLLFAGNTRFDEQISNLIRDKNDLILKHSQNENKIAEQELKIFELEQSIKKIEESIKKIENSKK